jgi:pyruvate dehydrogenase E2 component (dihydrolipoamide acetyltransferase)
MPALAANDSATVLAGWPLAEHSAFAAGDALATVETDKAVVDVEADADGVLLRTLVAEGTRVAVGDPIAVLGEPGEHDCDLDALLGERAAASAPAVSGGSDLPTPQPDLVDGDSPARLFASPLARRLARQVRVPLEELVGTGPSGRIVRRDIEAAIARSTTRTPAAAPPTGAPTPPAGYTERPHTRMRSAIAAALTASKQQVPHFYLRGTCRAARLVALRRELCAGEQATRISINDLLIKAVARAQRLVPGLNVSWRPEALRIYSDVDVAVAVATPEGLVTPVLRSADALPVSLIAERMRELSTRARAGTLRQHEIDGGGITITNLGMFGVEEFAAIINPPQAAILAVGAVTPQLLAEDGRPAVVDALRVTLSVDHRAVDGAVAAEWLRAFVSLVEHPAQILA